MRQPILIIMVKEPVAGRVKTRLGREIGMTEAAWWYRHTTRRLLRRLWDPRWQLGLAVTPDAAGLASRVWPRHIARMPQGTGDLGQRMARALRATPGPTLLIGSDIPDVSKNHIRDAFQKLGRAESVIGPAPDGGYWLVGLRHPTRAPGGLFSHVRWSSRYALGDTFLTLPKPVARAAELCDVDTAADLKTR